MSVPSSPCNSGCVFLSAYLLCAKIRQGQNKCAHGFQVMRTLGKRWLFSFPLFRVFEQYEETCLNQERDKKQLPGLKLVDKCADEK